MKLIFFKIFGQTTYFGDWIHLLDFTIISVFGDNCGEIGKHKHVVLWEFLFYVINSLYAIKKIGSNIQDWSMWNPTRDQLFRWLNWRDVILRFTFNFCHLTYSAHEWDSPCKSCWSFAEKVILYRYIWDDT